MLDQGVIKSSPVSYANGRPNLVGMCCTSLSPVFFSIARSNVAVPCFDGV